MKKQKAAPEGTTQLEQQGNHSIPTAPLVTAQCAEILSTHRQRPILSLTFTDDHSIPETAAWLHDLREKGYNIDHQIQESVIFRGRERKQIALYALGHLEWPRPGFQMPEPVNSQHVD